MPNPIDPTPGAHVNPTRDDPVLTSLSEGIGGPMGERSRGGWLTPASIVVFLAALCFAAGMFQKTTCFDASWTNESRYSHMCYSDLPYLYTGRGMVEHVWPYPDDYDPEVPGRFQVMEYPVGISYWAWGTSWVTHWLNGSPDLTERKHTVVEELRSVSGVEREIDLFVVVNAIGMAALVILAAYALTRVNPRRPWDAAIFALSPTLLLTGLINWDLLAVACVALALWAWAKDRPVLTGVLIGLGIAAKLYPLFLLGGLLVICWRQRRWAAFASATVAAALVWVVVNAPALLTGHRAWEVFWTFNSERGADLGSIWLVIAQAGDIEIDPHLINDVSWAFFGLWCLAVLILGLAAPTTPRLAQLGFLIVTGFLLINKVYSPQYVLWLLPLAALARPRWRDQLVWQAGEVLYIASVWWYLGGFLEPGAGEDTGFYWLSIGIRIACELYLVAIVVRDMLRPEHDPVRITAEAFGDDPDEVVGDVSAASGQVRGRPVLTRPGRAGRFSRPGGLSRLSRS